MYVPFTTTPPLLSSTIGSIKEAILTSHGDVTAWSGIDRKTEYPVLDAWVHRLLKRPGFEKGRHVPSPHTALDLDNRTEEEMNKQAEGARTWIQAAMKEGTK